MKLIIMLLVAAALSGCAVTTKFYEGQKKSEKELSIINQEIVQHMAKEYSYYVFELKKVDGKVIKTAGGTRVGGIELLPGKHTFTYKIKKVYLPSLVYVNKNLYDLTVTTHRGKKGAVTFKAPDGSPALCMYYSNINEPYQILKISEFPPATKYEYECHDVGVDLSDDAWIFRAN